MTYFIWITPRGVTSLEPELEDIATSSRDSAPPPADPTPALVEGAWPYDPIELCAHPVGNANTPVRGTSGSKGSGVRKSPWRLVYLQPIRGGEGFFFSRRLARLDCRIL